MHSRCAALAPAVGRSTCCCRRRRGATSCAPCCASGAACKPAQRRLPPPAVHDRERGGLYHSDQGVGRGQSYMVRRWARSGMGQSCSWSQLNVLSGLNSGEYQASTDSSLPRLGIRRNLNATCPPGPLAETLRPHKRKPPLHLIASAPPPALAPQHSSRPERSDSPKEFDENSPFEPADYDRCANLKLTGCHAVLSARAKPRGEVTVHIQGSRARRSSIPIRCLRTSAHVLRFWMVAVTVRPARLASACRQVQGPPSHSPGRGEAHGPGLEQAAGTSSSRPGEGQCRGQWTLSGVVCH